MPRRTLAFVVFAVILAVICIRLGIWQLRRLGERRTENRALAAQLDAPAVAWQEALRDSSRARFRRVQLTGRYDYTRELVLTSRGMRGAPGVHVLTPLLVDSGPPILVNRGWAYAADGMTVDLAKWREGDSATVDGYVDAFVPVRGMVSTVTQPRGVRYLQRDTIEVRLGEDIAPFLVVQRLGAVQGDTLDHLVRVELPPLDEGSHQNYAIQWFAFASIALGGAGVVASRARKTAG